MGASEIDHELYRKHFRVAVFGSARVRQKDRTAREIYKLAKLIAAENIDIVTGGGPGIMQAANKGHMEGKKGKDVYSFGLNIKLPEDQKANRHLDIKTEFHRFSERLDTFMMLSNAVVVAPGGVGTLLEFLYAWQLLQVKHISGVPIILLGKMWTDFMKWIRKHPLRKKFLDREDLDHLFLASDCNEAFEIIRRFHDAYKDGATHPSVDLKKYNVKMVRKKK
jgi:uncharacterized protein (TIGR00730 family)